MGHSRLPLCQIFTFLYDLKQLGEECFYLARFHFWLFGFVETSTVPHFIVFYSLPVLYVSICIMYVILLSLTFIYIITWNCCSNLLFLLSPQLLHMGIQINKQ